MDQKLHLSLLAQFDKAEEKAQKLEQERLRLEEVNKDRARGHLLAIRLLLARQQPIDE